MQIFAQARHEQDRRALQDALLPGAPARMFPVLAGGEAVALAPEHIEAALRLSDLVDLNEMTCAGLVAEAVDECAGRCRAAAPVCLAAADPRCPRL